MARDPWAGFPVVGPDDEDDDPWSAFPVVKPDATPAPNAAASDDPWAAFPEVDQPSRRKAARDKLDQAPQLPADATIDRALDGDTVRLTNGQHVRLPVVDAPELKQQGWNRQGAPVPIGEQSRDNIVTKIRVGEPHIGPTQGFSYNRLVAPIDIGGQDLGLTQAADGWATLDNRYLPSDPQQRYNYLQAERLARQNRLGIHGTMHVEPRQYRANPNYQPTREEVAQFWDTPTPNPGLTADTERGYLDVVNTGSAADIIAYANAHGFRVSPDDVQTFIAKRNSGAQVPQEVTYLNAPKPLTDPGDGRTGAGVRGLANGVLFNHLEELGAGVDTLGLTGRRENMWNSDRRLADIFANNLVQNESLTGHDRAFHPYASGAGELGGAFVVPMARVRSAADLARWGAAYGGLSGLGQEGTIPERLTSGAIGAGAGLVTTVLGGKALEAAVPYAERAVGRLTGKAPRRAPETPTGDFEGIGGRTPDRMDVRSGEPLVRARDRIAIDPAERQPQLPPEPFSAPYTGPATGGRDRDWIDVGQVPQPPRGYRRDPSGTRIPDRIEPAPGFLQGGKLTGDEWVGLATGQYQPRTSGNLAMAADQMPGVSQAVPRQPDYLDLGGVRPAHLTDPLTQEQMRRVANDISPLDILPINSNEVGSVKEAARIDAGRYAPATPVNEATALDSRTVLAQNGRQLSKRGPLDLVTWLRTQGGIQDQGGNLRAMGIDNRPRDLDFARGEQRFGKLVNNDSGMTMDDAAFKAWQAGYLPGSDRPDINTFLDAIDRTHSGAERYFHPNDLPEVEQFHGMRADRQALEEQLAHGPVHVDRSVPADEPQPFPPPQAYEEWPNGGYDFAGNINLNKLETPQDIRRALDMTNRRVGFDAATRGRVSQEETARLAGELGMTPEQLLSRRRGQALNAEEAFAARQIMARSGNELVNWAKRVQSMDMPGEDVMAAFRQAWMRHAAIQEQVSGMTAEAGRALQQFKMLADSRAVPRDVLSSIVGGAGGPDRIKAAADTLLEAVKVGPGKFNADVERLTKPRWRDKFTELYINNLLTNPATHVVNMTSNTLTALAQLPEHAVAAAIGGVRQVVPRTIRGRQIMPPANPDRVLGSELGARVFGMMQGAKEGARYFMQALRTGEPVDWASKVEHQNFKAISGFKGEVARLPTRFLTAEDELFKGIARRMELNGLAVRKARNEGLRGDALAQRIAELTTNPPDDMLARSMDYARYVTFQQKLGPAASKVSGITQDIPALKLFLPFVRTPTNLLKFAVERSPAAPLLGEWKADFLAGGARRDLALAKSSIGLGMGMVIYQAALDGRITGSPPTDEAKARLLYADGWQPYSIRVEDKWVSYKRLDPFATTIGTAADLALLPEGMSKRQQQDKATLLIASIMGNLASKTWLSGISDVVGALTEPDQNADNMLQRLAGSLVVPSGVAQLARVVDPVQREVGSIGEAIQARVPGASQSLPARRDVWGEKVESEGGVGPDLISPAYLSTAKKDPVNRELLMGRVSVGMVPAKVGGRELTPHEHERYQELAGKRSHAAVSKLVQSPGWARLDDEAKQAQVRKVVTTARANARAQLFGGPARESDGSADAWAGFPVVRSRSPAKPVNDPWSAFPVVQQPDVAGDLQRAIPGVQFTSGFRTPEYQADMRRRGYKPAGNSAHLDGSALDMLPPAGKSLGWLRSQVQRQYPKARLLIHDGHLHATLPDYFGAPVLGGAKAAGLRNPMARR